MNKSIFIVYKKDTRDVIAFITDKKLVAMEGYDVVETFAGNEPIFDVQQNGLVKLNLFPWGEEQDE